MFPVTEEDMGVEDMEGEDKVEVMAIVADMVVGIAFPLAMEEADMEVDMDMVVDIYPVATDTEAMAGPLIVKVTKEPGFTDIDKREKLDKTKLWKKFLKPSTCWLVFNTFEIYIIITPHITGGPSYSR